MGEENITTEKEILKPNPKVTTNLLHIAIVLILVTSAFGVGAMTRETQLKQDQNFFAQKSLPLTEEDKKLILAIGVEASNPCGWQGTIYTYQVGQTDKNEKVYQIGCIIK